MITTTRRARHRNPMSERGAMHMLFTHLYIYLGSAEWEKVEIPVWHDAGTWNFASSGDIDLSSYTDKTIQVAFLYKSTEQDADTWEIRNVRLYGYANQQGGIDDIESDSEAPVRYYDLSGRLVSGTPTAGLYLRVQGSHVEKVAVN